LGRVSRDIFPDSLIHPQSIMNSLPTRQGKARSVEKAFGRDIFRGEISIVVQ